MKEPRSGKRPPARLLVVDDHELARMGVIAVLEGEQGLEVCGQAASGGEAVDLCRRLRPDLVLMDIRMPDMDGLRATALIKQELPETSVVILTMQEDPDYLMAAIRAGAAGYLLKGSSRAELLAGLRRVRSGESLMDPSVMAGLVRRLAAQPAAADEPRQALTAREREVLRLLAEGETNPGIANRLIISRATVKAHVEHIIRKMGVSDRTQAAVRAVQLGLTQPS